MTPAEAFWLGVLSMWFVFFTESELTKHRNRKSNNKSKKEIE
jgi:hypothetical protein